MKTTRIRRENHTIRRPIVIAAAVAATLIFAGANAHLLYVALTSEPACVHHLKERSMNADQYRAAKSSC